MGLFSGEDVFFIDVVTGKLVSDRSNPLLDAVISAVLREENIADYIMALGFTGFSNNAKRYLDYGEKKYIYGLPEGATQTSQVEPSVVEAAISSELGEAVTVLSSVIATPYKEYFAYEFLQNSLNWRIKTNRMTVDGGEWRLNTISTNELRDPFGNIYVPATKIVITIQLTTLGDEDTLLDFQIDLPDVEPYVHAIYYLDSETDTDIQYWTYRVAAGTYPDIKIDKTPIVSEYYPIAPIRVDGKWIDEEDPSCTQPPCKTTKQLLRRVNLDFEYLIESIEKDNNDVDKLDDVFFLFALDIYTEVPESIEYLWNYLDRLEQASVVTKVMYDDFVSNIDITQSTPPVNGIIVEEQEFRTLLEFNYITRATVSGTLTEDFEKTLTDIPATQKTYTYVSDESWSWSSETPYEQTTKITLLKDTISIKKDNKDGTYTELVMHGPLHTSEVTALGKKAYIRKTIQNEHIRPSGTAIEDWDGYGKSGFFIPVSYEAIEEIDNLPRQHVLYDAMLLVFYAADKQHLEWYETGIFKALVQIVLLIITVILLIPTGGTSINISAFMMRLFLQIAASYVLNFVFELLVKTFGGKIAMIITLVAMVAFQFRGGFNFNGLASAMDLLKATSSVAKIGTQYVKMQTSLLGIDMADFAKTNDERNEELMDAYEQLDNSGGVDPLVIVAANMNEFKESPGDYYARTIHTGNPGVLSLDMIDTFYDRALRLPEQGESLRPLFA